MGSSEASITLRDLSQKDEVQLQMLLQGIAEELDIQVARSTLEDIFNDHYDMFRRKASHKSSLSAGSMEWKDGLLLLIWLCILL